MQTINSMNKMDADPVVALTFINPIINFIKTQFEIYTDEDGINCIKRKGTNEIIRYSKLPSSDMLIDNEEMEVIFTLYWIFYYHNNNNIFDNEDILSNYDEITYFINKHKKISGIIIQFVTLLYQVQMMNDEE